MKRLLFAFVLTSVTMATAANADPYSFSYGGRLADDSDKGIVGPINMSLRFWSAPTGGTDLLGQALTFSNVVLDDGVYELDTNDSTFSAAQRNTVFSAGNDTWVEVTDTTHNVTYPRQRMAATPFALKVPVDGKTISFDQNGNLTFVAGAPSPGQVLTTNASGVPVWGAPPSGSGGGVTSVVAGTGLNVTGGAAAITSSGTLNINVGTGANQIVQLDGSGRLPAVDASQVHNVPAGNMTGTVGISNGGTGAASLTGNSALVMNSGGTAATSVAPGTSGNVLTSVSGTWASQPLPSINWAVPGAIGSGTANTGAFTTLISSGNVGIGTPTPVSILQINGPTDPEMRIQEGGTVRLRLGEPTSNEHIAAGSLQYAAVITNDNGALQLGAQEPNNSNISEVQMTIATTGNVGIGTSQPGAKLDIKGASADQTTASLNVQNSSGTPILFARNDGNVGIGTATPTSTLQINGSIAVNVTSISTTTYTVLPNDYLIVSTSSAGANFTLPSCSTTNNPGRLLVIVNEATSSAVLLSGSTFPSSLASNGVAAGVSQRLVCNASAEQWTAI